MSVKLVNDDSLTSVANAIRVQGSISGTIEFPDGFVSAIQNLSPSPTLQTKSVTYTPSDSAVTDTVTADSGYDGLDEVDVTVNAVPEADFGASVGFQFYTEDGVKKCEVSGGGYAENAGWIDEGSVLTREVHPAIASGTTITPTTSSQTIGGYKNVMEGAVTINPIPSQYKDTTDATATADKILQGYTAYANGQKLTGTASGGITPSGTISITQNGQVDVTQYATADVNVSGGGGGVGTLLNTQSIGTVSTTSTSAITVGSQFQTDVSGYNYFLIVASADTVKASTHAGTVTLGVRTSGSSKLYQPYVNYGFKSSGVISHKSFPSGTQQYGLYPSISSSMTSLTITMKAVYNSTYTGTIDNDYTVRVYGISDSDLFNL